MSNAFANAVRDIPDSLTENGAETFSSTLNSCVDFFSKGGALRGKLDMATGLFVNALKEDKTTAVKIVMWLRDAREGAGERDLSRGLLRFMIDYPTYRKFLDEAVLEVVDKLPGLGRWDDLVDLIEFALDSSGESAGQIARRFEVVDRAISLIKTALKDQNGLCAKWLPRKGSVAAFLRDRLGLTPKGYRKLIVQLSDTVEQKMCSGAWGEIDYSKLPSIAQFRYQEAFKRHDEKRYTEFSEKAEAGEVKINAAVLGPHMVANLVSVGRGFASTVNAQWEALPNYVGAMSVIPVIDCSGSMGAMIPGTNITALDVSTGIGAYCATKNTGPFKNIWCEFSQYSTLKTLPGTGIYDTLKKLRNESWGGSTNIQAAFDAILKICVKNNVPAEDAPKALLIISDMEFNSCTHPGQTNFQAAREKYFKAGYPMPKVIFWNVMSRGLDNSPVRFDQNGTALISGFSPAILKTVLDGELENFSPINVMKRTLSNPRYDLKVAA